MVKSDLNRFSSKDSASKRSDIQAFALAQSSAQLNQFFVATDTGFILHLVREGERTGPRALQPNLEAMADVTSLQISPFEPSTLLVSLWLDKVIMFC